MSRSAMRASREGGSSRKRDSGEAEAFPALFLVVVVIFMLLVKVAGNEHGNHGSPGPDPRRQSWRPPSSLPRKVIPFTHALPPRGRKRTNKDGDSESLYDDNERIIHTGPNPLHN